MNHSGTLPITFMGPEEGFGTKTAKMRFREIYHCFLQYKLHSALRSRSQIRGIVKEEYLVIIFLILIPQQKYMLWVLIRRGTYNAYSQHTFLLRSKKNYP